MPKLVAKPECGELLVAALRAARLSIMISTHPVRERPRNSLASLKAKALRQMRNEQCKLEHADDKFGCVAELRRQRKPCPGH